MSAKKKIHYSNWKQKEEWNTGTEHCVAEECSFAGENKRVFYLTSEVKAVIDKLCEKIQKEWQLIMLGEETETGIIVSDYYIPKQEASYSTVKNLECIDRKFIEENKAIGTIHSHSGMQPFFSPTDDEMTNSSLLRNHIVVNNSGDYKAISRIDLPCGMVKFVEAAVKVMYSTEDKEIKGFENISVIEYQNTGFQSNWNTSESVPIVGKRKTHAMDIDAENYLLWGDKYYQDY